MKAEPKIKWWKQKNVDYHVEYRGDVKRKRNVSEELLVSWTDTTKVPAKKVLEVSYGYRIEDKGIWW